MPKPILILNLKTDKALITEAEQAGEYLYVGRGRGSIFGNPFTHMPLDSTKATFAVESRDAAIYEYERWLEGNNVELEADPQWLKTRLQILEKLEHLSPKISYLGCWCSPQNCHAEVIAKFIRKFRQKTERSV